MEEKIRIGISSCLLGENVRYDGGHKRDHFLTDTFGNYVEWVPVCPEVEYGLSVPREAMHLEGNPESPRLVTVKTRVDHTDGMLAWTAKKLKTLERKNLCGFIFKSKSPSSGMKGVKVYSSSGMPSKRGTGIFGGAFIRHFPLIPAEDDGRLYDPVLRDNFIERVFVLMRWRKFLEGEKSIRHLVSFHTDHKLLLLAHSPLHNRILGKYVADSKKYERTKLLSDYIAAMMDGLSLIATVKKNTNVLMHIMGYFKHSLSKDEKKELLEIIGNYHNAVIPLIVPIILMNHYVRKYDEPYLKRQHYLHPHPLELMLRNHV